MGHIFLIGFMGCGKTTVSKLLSKRISRPFYDTDELIVQKAGMSIPEIFEKYGEARFRELETEVLKSMASLPEGIVSCGGGIIKSDTNISAMTSMGDVVLLTAEPATFLERVSANNDRPLLSGRKNESDIRQLLDERSPYYDKAADYRVTTDNTSPGHVADDIISILDLT